MRDRKKLMKKLKNNNKNSYILCIPGMILLIAIALFLPQVIFTVQDRYRMTNTETEARTSLDISQLNSTYELETNARMKRFLNMKYQTVSSIDYEFSDDIELKELLENIFYQDWFSAFYDTGILSTYVFVDRFFEVIYTVELQDCKKFIIYEKDYQDGVALMMWYLDLYFPNIDSRMRILVDTETYTIYYMKVTTVEKQADEEKVTDQQVDPIYAEEERTEMLCRLADLISSYASVYYSYYESDDASLYEKNDGNINGTWFYETQINVEENQCTIKMQIPYEEITAELLCQMTYSDRIYPDIIMGLPAVGELIPEMIQD